MATTTRKGPGIEASLPSGKQPVSPLAGPYGHPFHPILVTVPIGAWVVSFIFDIAAAYSGEPEVFVKGAFWLIGVGIVGAIVAALFGLLDLFAIPRSTVAFRTGLIHMALNLTVVALFAVSFALRRSHLDEADATVPAVVLSVVALVLLAVSGWLGGKLAYRYGVRVADETTQEEGFAHH
jgi:uncharacterized membrane protein